MVVTEFWGTCLDNSWLSIGLFGWMISWLTDLSNYQLRDCLLIDSLLDIFWVLFGYIYLPPPPLLQISNGQCSLLYWYSTLRSSLGFLSNTLEYLGPGYYIVHVTSRNFNITNKTSNILKEQCGCWSLLNLLSRDN